MTHKLKGRKQTKEHIEKRRLSTLETFRKNPRQPLDMETKLLKKIMKNSNGCWLWTGSVFKKDYGNYGQIRTGQKLRRAHIVSYEHFIGEVPRGMELDHLCKNKLCINPQHLEPVTHRENMARGKLSETRNFIWNFQ